MFKDNNRFGLKLCVNFFSELFNVPVVNAIWRVLAGERLEADDPRLARTIHVMDRLFADCGSACGFLGFGSKKALLLFENLGLLQVRKGINYVFNIADEQVRLLPLP